MAESGYIETGQIQQCKGVTLVVKWIFLFSELMVLLTVFWTAKWDGQLKQQRIFSITLPAEAHSQPEVSLIQKNYRRRLRNSFLLIGAAILLSLFLEFRYFSLELIYFLLLLGLMIGLPCAFYGHANNQLKKLKSEKHWEAGQYSHGIHEDDFWLYGQFYNNPHDISRSVSKRMGLGTAINLAHRGQRRLFISAIAATLLLCIGLSGSLLYMEIKPPTFRIDSEMLYVDYPFYYYKLPIEDVKSLTVLQSLPAMYKENGIGTDTFARGYYRVEGYGRCFVCIYSEGPFIAIVTSQDTLIVNEMTQEKTYTLLEALDLVIPK